MTTAHLDSPVDGDRALLDQYLRLPTRRRGATELEERAQPDWARGSYLPDGSSAQLLNLIGMMRYA